MIGGFKGKVIDMIFKEGQERLDSELDYIQMVKILRKLKHMTKKNQKSENDIEITDENIIIDMSDQSTLGLNSKTISAKE